MFNLHLSKKLIISALRCTVQLTIMGFVLVPVFESNNVYLVMGIAGASPRQGRNEGDAPPDDG